MATAEAQSPGPRPTMPRRTMLACSLLVALTLVVLVPSAWRIHATIASALATGDDFYQYWTGAESLAGARSPYAWLTEERPLGPSDYHYPPLLALLLAPLTRVLDFATARWLWLALSVGCLVLSALLIWRATGLRLIGRPALALVPLLALWPATSGALSIGQLSPQLLLLVTLAFLAVLAQRPLAAGAVLAFGAYLKTFPALLGGYLALRGQWRALLAGLAAGALLVGCSLAVLGPAPLVDYFVRVVPLQARWFGGPFNLSVTGLVTRLFVENGFTTPVADLGPLGRALANLAPLPLAAVSAFAVWRAPRDRLGESAAFSLALLTALLASPINGEYNLVLALLPLAILAARVQAAWPRGLRWLLLAALLLGLPTDPCDLAGVREACLGLPDLSALPWRSGWGNLLTAGPLCGLLVLWARLLYLCCVQQPSRAARRAPGAACASAEALPCGWGADKHAPGGLNRSLPFR